MKKHLLLIIACSIAAVSMLFVPPNAGYVDYFDFRTLCCLFCISAVVAALVETGLFNSIAQRFVSIFKTQRACVLALVTVTLVGAMFITNDMALLTFLPLSLLVLGPIAEAGNNSKLLIWCFVLQNAAAVLGGMILPFGNPHNLYLYNLFEIPTGTFLLTMLPTFVTALVLIYGCCFLFVKATPLEGSIAKTGNPKELAASLTASAFKLIVYVVLFVLTLAAVLKIVPYLFVTAIVLVCILILNPKVMGKVNWELLLTFVAFFVFTGNMTHIPTVANFLTSALQENMLLTTVLTCQVISNLPTTLLFAPFISATSWPTLLVATDIAGMGTPIASLAALITISTFMEYGSKDAGAFYKIFLSVGVGFLVVLMFVAYLTL